MTCAIALAAGNLFSIGFVLERNYNEGWNVYNAQRLIDHELIYDDNYWRVNNYPIFSFLAVAGVNLLVNNLLWHSARYHLAKYLHLGEFPLAVMLLFVRSIFTRDRSVLAAYGIISIFSAAIFSGFEGASYNMFQDAAVFLGIAAGITLLELRTREIAEEATPMTKLALGIAPLLLAQPILARSPQAIAPVFHVGDTLESVRRAERSFLDEVQ
jgi:hypothetical protein